MSQRVGILIASLQAGGAERAALNLLEGLVASGVDAYLLTLDGNHEMEPLVDERQRAALASRIVRLSAADIGRSTLTKTLSGPWQWLQFQRAARRLRLQTVVSIVERANIVNLLGIGPWRRVISIRSYFSALLASKTPLKRWLVRKMYGLFLPRAHRIVFVSREAAADFERLFPAAVGRGAVIYNICHVDRVKKLSSEPLPDGYATLFDGPVVTACGRMNPEKGHWSLLRAFSRVSQADPNVRLVLLGDGPMRERLCRLRDELGLGDRVSIPGFQRNPLAWIARSQAFVLPSLWEGFPNILIEALAAGVPVVSTDCRSGPRELLAPDSDPDRKTSEIEHATFGLLVPAPGERELAGEEPLSREEAMLARAMEMVLHDNGFRRVATESAVRRAGDFSPERIVAHWIELIAGMAG